MKLRMILMLIIVGAVGLGIFAFKSFINGKIKESIASSFAPPTVSTIKAMGENWQPQIKAVGSLRAVNGADLSSELAGIVEKLSFESGADVTKDTVLVQLRNDDDIAKMHSFEAAAKLAEINYQRDLKQVKAQAVSQATVDADAATLESNKAQVAAQRALIDKKTIRAPFAGHLGIRQVDVGQYLNPGTPIVTLQQLDPIYVDFTLPEQSLTKIQAGQKIALQTDVMPDKIFYGEISAINSKVDEATRNIVVRATVPNSDRKLLPGMFGTVIVAVDQTLRYITLPQAAIVFNTYGNTVYKVEKKEGGQLTAIQSVVITGDTRGDQIAILSGIKEGDEIVTSGQVKLRNGTPVVINNEIQPSNDPNPTPHEH